MVVLLAQSVHPFTALASGPYKSFAKDGISDAEFEHRIQAVFLGKLMAQSKSTGVVLDSVTPFHSADDSSSFQLGDQSIKAYFAKADLDTTKLHLFFGPMVFSTGLLNMPGLGGSGGTTSSHLYAKMNWLVFDPRSQNAIAGGRLEASSTTFAVVTNIITQSDWYADAGKLADDLKDQLAGIRK
jgi:hypothetical protein